MPISEHPLPGTILRCDFTQGFTPPEMTKMRPVVVVSPKISRRAGLCTVIPLSTRPPSFSMAYHYEIKQIDPPLPPPFDTGPNWVKGDMIVSVGFHRLDFIRLGKNQEGRRLYRLDTLPEEDMKAIRKCILSGLGLISLTKYL